MSSTPGRILNQWRVNIVVFYILHSYEPDRRKHRGKSGGERQKLQYKLKKELKVNI